MKRFSYLWLLLLLAFVFSTTLQAKIIRDAGVDVLDYRWQPFESKNIELFNVATGWGAGAGVAPVSTSLGAIESGGVDIQVPNTANIVVWETSLAACKAFTSESNCINNGYRKAAELKYTHDFTKNEPPKTVDDTADQSYAEAKVYDAKMWSCKNVGKNSDSWCKNDQYEDRWSCWGGSVIPFKLPTCGDKSVKIHDGYGERPAVKQKTNLLHSAWKAAKAACEGLESVTNDEYCKVTAEVEVEAIDIQPVGHRPPDTVSAGLDTEFGMTSTANTSGKVGINGNIGIDSGEAELSVSSGIEIKVEDTAADEGAFNSQKLSLDSFDTDLTFNLDLPSIDLDLGGEFWADVNLDSRVCFIDCIDVDLPGINFPLNFDMLDISLSPEIDLDLFPDLNLPGLASGEKITGVAKTFNYLDDSKALTLTANIPNPNHFKDISGNSLMAQGKKFASLSKLGDYFADLGADPAGIDLMAADFHVGSALEQLRGTPGVLTRDLPTQLTNLTGIDGGYIVADPKLGVDMGLRLTPTFSSPKLNAKIGVNQDVYEKTADGITNIGKEVTLQEGESRQLFTKTPYALDVIYREYFSSDIDLSLSLDAIITPTMSIDLGCMNIQSYGKLSPIEFALKGLAAKCLFNKKWDIAQFVQPIHTFTGSISGLSLDRMNGPGELITTTNPPQKVPEPRAVMLMLLGVVLIGHMRRQRRKS